MDENYESRLSRFLGIAKRLQRAGVPHFTATVTQSPLEIPASFVRDHGENMKPLASVRLESGSKVWSLQIHVCYSVRFRVRFCQLWRGFLSDNGLKKGDVLIVSLVAMSEFVIYTLKTNLDSWRLSRNSQFNDTTSPSSSDKLPDANTPTSTLRTSPSNPSTGMDVEMQKGSISDNFRASPITLDRDKFNNQTAETERDAEIPANSFYGKIYFRKQMSEASIGHFGNPQFARIEIPSDFVRRHGSLLSEGTLITLEGPMPGTISQVVCRHGPMNRRIMWRQGWPSFVRRNKLRKGVNLEFSLTAPSRFSVMLLNSSIPDPSLTVRNANVSRKDRGSTAREGKTSNTRPTKHTNRSAAVDPHENPYFIKTLSATSVPTLTAYPFLVVPSSFQHTVKLPLEVNLQGPSNDEIFSVKYSGVVKEGTTKTSHRDGKTMQTATGSKLEISCDSLIGLNYVFLLLIMFRSISLDPRAQEKTNFYYDIYICYEIIPSYHNFPVNIWKYFEDMIMLKNIYLYSKNTITNIGEM